MKKRTKPTTTVTVIGAGVTGLTTAIELRKNGYVVNIVADKFAPEITSVVAGALWEFPPAVCGYHGAERSLERSKEWCMTSYDEFQKIAKNEESGVYLRDVSFYFKAPIEKMPREERKMNELKDKVVNFRKGADLIEENGIKYPELVDAYQHMAPMVDTDVYMQYLLKQAQDMGCNVIHERVEGSIISREAELLEKYQSDLLVNCTGLGSIDLASNLYPLRGSLIRVKDPERTLTKSFCISHNENSDEQDIVFIVPRGKDKIILGGTAEPNQWNTKLDFRHKPVRDMYKRNTTFLPQLLNLEIDEKEPVRTGLRPFTQDNVCLERTPGTRIIHNYGHGGAGVTLSWGCAKEVVEIADQIEREKESDQNSYIPNIVKGFDPNKKNVFVIQNVMTHRADFGKLNQDANLIFIGSKSALSNLLPSQYHNFSLVKRVNDFTVEEVSAEMSRIAKEFGINMSVARVITNDDLSVGLASELREAFDMRGERPSVAKQFSNKHDTKMALQGSDVVLPKNTIFNRDRYREDKDGYLQELIDTLGESIFVKMVEGAGSENTKKITGKEELKDWCEKNLDSKIEFEIDEFIQGKLYNISTVMQGGEIVYFSALEHARPNDEFLQGKTLGNMMIREDDPRFNEFKDYANKVLTSLSGGYPQNGVINIDFFVDKNEQPILMEIAARAPGGLISSMYEKCDGIHLEEAHLKLSMDENCRLGDLSQRDGLTAAYVIYPCIDDKVREIVTPNLQSNSKFMWKIYPGKTMTASKSMREVAVGVMIWGSDRRALQQDFDMLCNTPVYKGYQRTETEKLEAVSILQGAMRGFLSNKNKMLREMESNLQGSEEGKSVIETILNNKKNPRRFTDAVKESRKVAVENSGRI